MCIRDRYTYVFNMAYKYYATQFCCWRIAGDEFNSESFITDSHPTSKSTLDASQISLPHWVKEQIKYGKTGKELYDMITYEVELQNKGRDTDQQKSSNPKSRLTPEKMKLVAPAILSKILQSNALNR